MKQSTKRFSSIILSLVFLVGAGLGYFEFVVPAYSALQTEKGQEISEQAVLTNEKQVVSQVQTLLATYQSEASGTQMVGMALPVGQDLSGGIAQIYGLAQNAQVGIQTLGISVQAIAPQAAASGGGSIANAATTGGSITKPYGTISFEITGSGSYEQLKTFLENLESNIRIFDVTGITIAPSAVAASKTQAANTDLFTYSIDVNTYYQSS